MTQPLKLKRSGKEKLGITFNTVIIYVLPALRLHRAKCFVQNLSILVYAKPTTTPPP